MYSQLVTKKQLRLSMYEDIEYIYITGKVKGVLQNGGSHQWRPRNKHMKEINI